MVSNVRMVRGDIDDGLLAGLIRYLPIGNVGRVEIRTE